jgi:hypothetical protein
MALSLKQQLNNQTTELTNFEATIAQLTIDVSEAVDFHKNILHDDDNVKALADRVTTNASSITSLNTTTSAQATEIS